VDFHLSPRVRDLLERMQDFMDTDVFPAEAAYRQYRLEHGPADHRLPPVVEELKVKARARGLWNLFLPAVSGLANLEYAPLAELSGWSVNLAPEAMNCAAPDTGNMEVLQQFGTGDQRRRWLDPLLDGRIRSGFAMTEPDVASSDATNIATSIVRDGDHYVINGRKWWTTGVLDPRCSILIVMGKSDPAAPAYRQQSMIGVPVGSPGVEVVRGLPVFGYQDQHGHAEISFTDVRVPAANLIGGEGDGFAIAQARLGPGRVHHAMRCVGVAERALSAMVTRAQSRVAFGSALSGHGVVQQQIAESRMEIEQARLLILKTAWMIDELGARNARTEIAAIKVIGPRVATAVLDRAIQVHGGAGVSDDLPLAEMYAGARVLRIADGPDEIHVRTVALRELARHRPATAVPDGTATTYAGATR
jgi:acyl-CoA dehydrogenase